MTSPTNRRGTFPERLARSVSCWTGTSLAFLLALAAILIWLVSGPLFGFSDTWQLVINTTTTIITFLMVFLIQRAQNKEMISLHLKLNELIAVLKGASNRLINIEDMSEEEIATLHNHFAALADLATRECTISQSHSIEEAAHRHRTKKSGGRTRRKPKRLQKPLSDGRGPAGT
jgi:low affinity Fe/Cu permease